MSIESQNLTVLHIPHASHIIPSDLRSQFLLDDSQLAVELVQMTDSFTDILFGLDETEAARIIFPVSRLVVDAERFEQDTEEPMARCGMGVIYTRTSCGAPLRPVPSVLEREELLNRYYRPHHAALTKAVAKRLNRFGRCLLIDAHSYPSEVAVSG